MPLSCNIYYFCIKIIEFKERNGKLPRRSDIPKINFY